MTNVDLDEIVDRDYDLNFIENEAKKALEDPNRDRLKNPDDIIYWLVQRIRQLEASSSSWCKQYNSMVKHARRVETERDEALEALKWALNGVQEELDAMARDTENLEEVEARIQQALTSVDDQEANND